MDSIDPQNFSEDSKTKVSENENIILIQEEKKIISIIVPTYNVPDFLDECIESILLSCKNYEDCEILIGIDFCQNTLNHVLNKEFSKSVKFFYFDEHVGPYVIKNTLAKLSNSEKLFFFDSDDVMHESLISVLIEKLNIAPCIKPLYYNFSGELTEKKKKSLTKSNHYGEGVFGIRKKTFIGLGGFEPWMCAADSDFMVRIQRNRIITLRSTDGFFYRRIHKQNLTQQKETTFGSEMRNKYVAMTNAKKNWGPLSELAVQDCFLILDGELKKFEFDYKKPEELPSLSPEEIEKAKKQELKERLRNKKKYTEEEKKQISEKRKEILSLKNKISLEHKPIRIVKRIQINKFGGRNKFNF